MLVRQAVDTIYDVAVVSGARLARDADYGPATYRKLFEGTVLFETAIGAARAQPLDLGIDDSYFHRVAERANGLAEGDHLGEAEHGVYELGQLRAHNGVAEEYLRDGQCAAIRICLPPTVMKRALHEAGHRLGQHNFIRLAEEADTVIPEALDVLVGASDADIGGVHVGGTQVMLAPDPPGAPMPSLSEILGRFAKNINARQTQRLMLPGLGLDDLGLGLD